MGMPGMNVLFSSVPHLLFLFFFLSPPLMKKIQTHDEIIAHVPDDLKKTFEQKLKH